MNIKTDGKDLLESETFVAVGLGETVVTIGAGQEMLSFVFDFVQDEDKPEGKISIKWAVVDSKTLRVTLQNWNNSLGRHSLNQLKLEPTTTDGFSFCSSSGRSERKNKSER